MAKFAYGPRTCLNNLPVSLALRLQPPFVHSSIRGGCALFPPHLLALQAPQAPKSPDTLDSPTGGERRRSRVSFCINGSMFFPGMASGAGRYRGTMTVRLVGWDCAPCNAVAKGKGVLVSLSGNTPTPAAGDRPTVCCRSNAPIPCIVQTHPMHRSHMHHPHASHISARQNPKGTMKGQKSSWLIFPVFDSQGRPSINRLHVQKWMPEVHSLVWKQPRKFTKNGCLCQFLGMLCGFSRPPSLSFADRASGRHVGVCCYLVLVASCRGPVGP